VAFNVLLAGVPFILLLASGLGYLLGESSEASTELLEGVLARLLPARQGVEASILHPVMEDVVRTRAAFGIGGAIGFLVFSSRLFGSLRTVMKRVFEHGRDRSFIGGVLWDLQLSLTSAVLMTAWVALSAWLALSRGRIGAALTDLGALNDVLGGVEYWLGRALALAVVVAIFVSLYRWLPKKRTPWIPVLAGGATAGLLFELARWIFAVMVRTFPPASVFTGTLSVLVVIVFWTYYVALIFVLGAETAIAVEGQLDPAEPP
jgi:membrane protein